MEGDRVWVTQPPTIVYGVGVIKSIDHTNNTVLVEGILSTCSQFNKNGITSIRISKQHIQPYNIGDEGDHQDLVSIQDLNESSLLHNLGKRYNQDIIYSWIGNILVSMNPYKDVQFGGGTIDKVLQKYDDIDAIIARVSPPHVYAVASKAYSQLMADSKNQAIVISGESGSGKTEAAKLIIQYLVHKSSINHSKTDRTGKIVNIEKDILASSPILEAFGNSQTPRNNNSSRFGKFIKVEFGMDGSICGAQIETYLLEKSRISHRPDNSNLNYHIFYSMLISASRDDLARWMMPDNLSPKQLIQSFRYLDAQPHIIEATIQQQQSNSHAFGVVKQAMQAINIGERDLQSIMSTLAAILHIGNIGFEQDSDTKYAFIPDSFESSVHHASQLLGFPPSMFRVALLNRKLKASGRGSVYARPNDIAQAEESRDSLAKSLYANLFKFIVDAINKKFKQQSTFQSSTKFIGVLDIFGFENLSNNSLEQLLINFTNEKLQSQFNQAVFYDEQKEYVAEGLKWTTTTFADNKNCIDLIEKKGEGVLGMLDEECIVPKGSEIMLIDKCNQKFPKTNPSYQRALSKGTFGVRHFAGDVTYNVDGWLEKNRDSLHNDMEELLNQANQFIKSLFTTNSTTVTTTSNMNGNTTRSPSLSSTVSKKQVGASVSSQFLGQLTSLVSTLNSTTLHYIRCIKPNQQLAANTYDAQEVLLQLRSVGLMSTVQVRKMGYSYRRDYNSFYNRYSILKKTNHCNNRIDQCKYLIEWVVTKHGNKIKDKTMLWTAGKTKIFMSDEMYGLMEKERSASVENAVLVIARFIVAVRERRRFVQMRQQSRVLQLAIRAHIARKQCKVLNEAEQKRLIEQKKKEEEQRKLEEKKRLEEEKKAAEEEKKRREKEEAARKQQEKIQRQEEEAKRKLEEKKAKEEKKRLEEEEKKRKKGKKDGVALSLSSSTEDFQQQPDTSTTSTSSSGNTSPILISTPSSPPLHSQSSLNLTPPNSPFEKWRKREAQSTYDLTIPQTRPRFPGIGVRKQPQTSQPIPIPVSKSGGSKLQLSTSPSSSSEGSPTSPSSPQHRISVSQSSSFDYGAKASRKSTKIQSPPTISPSSPTMSPQLLRLKIINEIIETEKDYCRDLQIILDIFLNPIREKSLMNPKDIQIMFGNIEILININQTMLEELEKNEVNEKKKEKLSLTSSISEDDVFNGVPQSPDDSQVVASVEGSNVGAAFLKMSHYLKMYSSYCSNQHQALKTLEDEKIKNIPFRNYLEEKMLDTRCRGLPLLSFLIKPVQRICKYPLLLKEILKYTPEGHAEYTALVEADVRIGHVVSLVNEGKRSAEMFEKIFDLQSSIENIGTEEIVKPGRVLLQQATVTGVRELSSDDTLQRFLFLFNDLIIICGPSTTRAIVNNLTSSKKFIYRLKAFIPISDARIMFVSDSDSVRFALEICNIKSNESFILCFANESQRSSWLKQIKTMIQELKFSSSGRSRIGGAAGLLAIREQSWKNLSTGSLPSNTQPTSQSSVLRFGSPQK